MKAEYYIHVSCPDRAGIIAAITGAIAQARGNILDLRQHTATDIDTFFLAALFEVELDGLEPASFESGFGASFVALAADYSMEWELSPKARKRRVAILVSKTSHCLYELLLKRREGELDCDFPVIIGNHADLEPVAAQFGIPFRLVGSEEGKQASEARIQDILEEQRIDLVVLARYMQILSPEFSERWKERIINIHHGFLPAFKGAKPYHQAWQKGVKLIGATAHFVTADLDQGPIISQDVLRVSDNASIAEFIRMGKDIERKVLVDALSRYLSHSVFIKNGRTFALG
jgi:formyltetrahydrofolate deformylase